MTSSDRDQEEIRSKLLERLRVALTRPVTEEELAWARAELEKPETELRPEVRGIIKHSRREQSDRASKKPSE